MITESDELSRALDYAAKRWPEQNGQRSLLLKKILEEATAELLQQEADKNSERLTHIKRVAGSMSDVWPENWREELANDWPK